MSFLTDQLNITKKIGSGATGDVYLAIPKANSIFTNTNYALKTIFLNRLNLVSPAEVRNYCVANDVSTKIGNKILSERRKEFLTAAFKFEAETLKNLNHPHIVRFYDCGYFDEKKCYYIVFELIEGEDLFTATENLDFIKKEEIFIKILRGLNYLHHNQIFHFDLKDKNIILTKNQNELIPKIIDFGLANFNTRIEYQNLTSQSGPGTPHYMAPEIWIGDDKDQRADLYALGVIFFHCLTRQFPFNPEKVTELKDCHLKSVPVKPSKINPDIPDYWDRIISRLLEKNPSDRYPDAGFVIREIRLASRKDYKIETKETQISYEPSQAKLIGRENETTLFKKLADDLFIHKNGESSKLIVIKGALGTGKTRFLEEIKFKTLLDYNIDVKTWEDLESLEDNKPYLIILDSNPNYTRNHVSQFLLRSAEKPYLTVYIENDPNAHWESSIEINLSNLKKEDIAVYLKQIIRSDNPPDHIVDYLFHQTNGNPLLLVQLIAALIQQEFLVDAQGPWPETFAKVASVHLEEEFVSNLFDETLMKELTKLNLDNDQMKILSYLASLDFLVSSHQLEKILKLNSIDELLYPLIKNKIIFENDFGQIEFTVKPMVGILYNRLTLNEKLSIHRAIATNLDELDESKLKWHQACAESDFTKKCQLFLELAFNYENQGDYKQAIFCLEKVLSFKNKCNQPIEDIVKSKLVKALFLSGDYQKARRIAEPLIRYLSFEKPENHQETLWNVSDILLQILMREQNIDSTYDRLDAIRKDLFDYLQDPKNKNKNIFYTNRWAQYYLMIDDIEKAERMFLSTLDQVSHLKDDQKGTIYNNDLEEVYFRKKDFDKAISICRKKLEQVTSPVSKARCHNFIATSYFSKGEIDSAKDEYNRCIQIAEQTHDFFVLCRTYNVLASMFYDDSKTKLQAGPLWQQALNFSQKIGDNASIGAIAYNMALFYVDQNNFLDALHYLTYSIRSLEAVSSESISNWKQMARCKIEMISVLKKLNRTNQIKKYLDEITFILKEKISDKNEAQSIEKEIENLISNSNDTFSK